MGLMDKVKDFIGYGDDDYEDDDYEEEIESSKPSANIGRYTETNTSISKKGNIIKVHSNSEMKIFICDAEKYEDCTKVVDELKNRKAVVLNIENLDLALQQQIFEFIKGSVYALEADIQKVSQGIFVIAPISVQIDERQKR